MNTYGITLEAVRAAFKAQDGKCDICRQPFDLKKEKKPYYVDHDHSKKEKGHFRGLLCQSCNSSIGYLKDKPVWALNAAIYLMKHQPYDLDELLESVGRLSVTIDEKQ